MTCCAFRGPKDLSATRRTLHTVLGFGHCEALRGPIPGQDFVYIGVHLVALPLHLRAVIYLLVGAICMAVARRRTGADSANQAGHEGFLAPVLEASPGVARPATRAVTPKVITLCSRV